MIPADRFWDWLADCAVRVCERALARRERDEFTLIMTREQDRAMAFGKLRWRVFTVESDPKGWRIISTTWTSVGPVPDSSRTVGHFLPEFSESQVREQAQSLQDHCDAVRAQRGGL